MKKSGCGEVCSQPKYVSIFFSVSPVVEDRQFLSRAVCHSRKKYCLIRKTVCLIQERCVCVCEEGGQRERDFIASTELLVSVCVCMDLYSCVCVKSHVYASMFQVLGFNLPS